MNIREKIGPVVFATGVFIPAIVGAVCYTFVWNGDMLPMNAMRITIVSGFVGFILVIVGMLLRVPPQVVDMGTEHDDRISEAKEQTKRAIEKDANQRKPDPPPAANASQDEWFKWYDQVTGGSSVKPDPPVDENTPKDMWLHWYHYVIDVQGYRMTLKDLGSVMGVSYGTVRKYHSDYQTQYGEQT